MKENCIISPLCQFEGTLLLRLFLAILTVLKIMSLSAKRVKWETAIPLNGIQKSAKNVR